MGLATAAEQEELAAMCKQHPEVAHAKEAFEMQLENNLLTDAVAPPVALKEKIWGSLQTTTETEKEVVYQAPVKKLNKWKIAAAASIILLAGTVFWAFSLNNKYQNLQKQNIVLKQNADEALATLNNLKEDAAMMQKPSMKMAALHGTAHAPASFATIYWDTTSKDVYLMVNNLPQPATDKQYQLWALINDQPVDLGVIIREEKLLVKMKNVQNAQAFAITLEPRGGSPSPTLNEMYVMGKL